MKLWSWWGVFLGRVGVIGPYHRGMRIGGSAGFSNWAMGASRALGVLMILMVMGGLGAFAADASARETWSPSAAAQ